MKLASFKTSKDDKARLGVVIENLILDLSGEIDGMLTLILTIPDGRAYCEGLVKNAATKGATLRKLSDVKLEAPIAKPGKIICLAGNYREHITESGFVVPEAQDVITQQLFIKPSSALTCNDDEILIRPNNVKVGWETELAVVISKRGRNIPATSAFEHVFSYMILNDVSERGLNSSIQNRCKREMDRFLDWLAGKWFDTFAPCGPWIVTADEIERPQDLEIKLTINGELRQQGNTSDMIFNIAEQIAYASSIMTLEPGDIISTGTPAGAGLGGAKDSLQHGDELICEIQKIGTLRNRVRYID
jgi:2-keto-4-pentenoate hydratase/2-oxohepta-3-ene-1,7-dioic acid hydratase in catechol pathway